MAAAEARAVWQRASNRYLVQEDAKRAPKLACCPSSAPQNDSDNENIASARDHVVPNFMPLKRNSMNANVSPETKWWLQMQPYFGYQKDFICEQLSSLECEHGEEMETGVPTLELDGKSMPLDFANKKEDRFLESPRLVSTASIKHSSENRAKDMKTICNSQQPLKRKNAMDDHLCKEEDLLDFKAIDRLSSKRPEKALQDFETPWAGANKSEPWWRVTDKDDLALLVAQKSLLHFENCDLPKTSQTVHVAGDEKFDAGGKFQSSLNKNINAGIRNGNDCSHNSSTSQSHNNKNSSSSEKLHGSEKPYSRTRDYVKREQPEDNVTATNDLSRDELLEALRRSQTRAREAEIAAQKAYHEKEHTVKLLFRQASNLFAYKQWIQMLQIQNLVLQLKIMDHQMLPWMHLKRKLSDRERKLRRGRKKHKCYICKYAVFFAVGLGLAGAGLLFGLTIGIGWFFPE